MSSLHGRIAFCLVFLIVVPVQAMAYLSDGSDGMFNPENSMSLDLPEGGIFNFTSIFIDSDVNITFNPSIVNNTIYLLATEKITIKGNIDVSGFFNGDGGNLIISAPGMVRIGGDISAKGNPNGGEPGSISMESATMVSLSADAYLSAVGHVEGGNGTITNRGSIILTGGSGSGLIISSTFDGVLNGNITIGSGELKLSPVPVPSAIFLLASGMTGLAGLRRMQP